MEDSRKFEFSPRVETIAFIALTLTALLIRLNHLSADPPFELSTSQDVYTDPAQYTSYARNLILYGSFNPLHDFRLVFFLKSATTLLSVIIFKIFGAGYWQGNLVGLSFSFSTMILLYFSLRKIAGNVAALLFMGLISLDFNQIFYGRLPFLENSMNFFAVLAFIILIYSRKAWAFLFAGVFLGAGIFFSKIIGLIYLFPFASYAAYEYFHDFRPNWKQFLQKYLWFIGGFLALVTFWLFYSYLPMSRSVTGYIEEQAFSLYGAPDAFQSPADFLYKFISLGFKSKLFGRMPVAALLCWGMLVVFFYRIGRKENWRRMLLGINPGMVFFIALVLGGYGALMIWNYRPLRYQTMLIFPMYALAAVFLSRLLSRPVSKERSHSYRLFPLIFMICLMIPLFQLMRPSAESSETSFVVSSQPLIFLAVILALTVILLLAWKYLRNLSILKSHKVRRGFVLLAFLAVVVPNAINYFDWSSRATYLTDANSKDIALILSPEAVVSGPYAADLTQENLLFNLIHMFGVANVDSAFFRRYPITHLLVDMSNEATAREHYPRIMDSAKLISYYYAGGRRIRLYRVAGLTGNVAADQYKWSYFETAAYYYMNNKVDSGHYYMKNFQLKHPNNYSANFVSGKMAFAFQMYDEAEYFYKKAIEFSPTDFHLRMALGEFYIRMFRMTGKPDYRQKALAEFAMATKFNPGSQLLERNIDDFLNNRDVGETE